MNQTIPASGQFGLIQDVAPQELPPNGWSAAQNFRYRDGCAERFRGDSQVLTTPTIVPYFIAPYRTSTARFWVYAGTQKVFCDDGSTQTELTPVSTYLGGVDDKWTGGTASGIMVINNGVDQPQFWAGSTLVKFANLTGWNSAWRVASLRPFKQYLVSLDVTKSGTRFPYMVKWSGAAVPGALPSTWDETDATHDAGEQDLAETTDFLVDSLPLGDVNILYKERSMYGMQYIGGVQVFRFWRLPGDVGMIARGCAVNTPAGHVVLTAGDLILHNGQGAQSIVTGRDRKWLFNSIDQTNFARSFLAVNRPTNEVWVCFPESGMTACTLALVWNWKDDTFGVRKLSNFTAGANGTVITSTTSTWASDTNSWDSDATSWNSEGFGANEDRLLMTTTGPLISLMETGATMNGSNPTCFTERTGMAFDKPDLVKTVRSVVPRVDAVAGTQITVEVGGSMDAEVAPMWSPPVTYTVGTDRKADAFASGRFLSVRFTSTGAQPWRIKSYDMELTKRGPY